MKTRYEILICLEVIAYDLAELSNKLDFEVLLVVSTNVLEFCTKRRRRVGFSGRRIILPPNFKFCSNGKSNLFDNLTLTPIFCEATVVTHRWNGPTGTYTYIWTILM